MLASNFDREGSNAMDCAMVAICGMMDVGEEFVVVMVMLFVLIITPGCLIFK